MNKWACNRGGKAVWWGLFRVWVGLVIYKERERENQKIIKNQIHTLIYCISRGLERENDI